MNTILGLSVKDGVFMLSLLPYFALYCRSAQEFFGERIIDNDTDRQINDLRNGLKLYSKILKSSLGRTKKINLKLMGNIKRDVKLVLRISEYKSQMSLN